MRFIGICFRATAALFAVIVVGILVGLVCGGALIALWQATVPLADATVDVWAQIGLIAAPRVHGVLQVLYFALYCFAILISIGVVASRSENL